MNKKNIKLIQWACRIIPVFTWSFYFFVLYLPEKEANSLLKEPVWSIVFIFIIFSYILLVFLVLPGLIFGEKYKGFKFYFISWLLTAATAGIAPVILYWLKVDRKLSEYASEQDKY